MVVYPAIRIEPGGGIGSCIPGVYFSFKVIVKFFYLFREEFSLISCRNIILKDQNDLHDVNKLIISITQLQFRQLIYK